MVGTANNVSSWTGHPGIYGVFKRISEENLPLVSMFTICTYNVHSLYDAQGKDSLDRIVQFLNEEKPDVLCLQEISGHSRRQLQPLLGYKEGFNWAGCAILSNLPMERLELLDKESKRGYHPRFLTVKLTGRRTNPPDLLSSQS